MYAFCGSDNFETDSSLAEWDDWWDGIDNVFSYLRQL